MKRNDPRHGTTNAYSNLGCRCDRCRTAWATYCREYMHRRGMHKPRAVWLVEVRANPPAHGTESRYTAHKCRCDECKRASREARQRRRTRSAA